MSRVVVYRKKPCMTGDHSTGHSADPSCAAGVSTSSAMATARGENSHWCCVLPAVALFNFFYFTAAADDAAVDAKDKAMTRAV